MDDDPATMSTPPVIRLHPQVAAHEDDLLLDDLDPGIRSSALIAIMSQHPALQTGQATDPARQAPQGGSQQSAVASTPAAWALNANPYLQANLIALSGSDLRPGQLATPGFASTGRSALSTYTGMAKSSAPVDLQFMVQQAGFNSFATSDTPTKQNLITAPEAHGIVNGQNQKATHVGPGPPTANPLAFPSLFSITEAAPVQANSSTARPLPIRPSPSKSALAGRRLQNSLAAQSRKIRTGRVGKPPVPTDAQKKRFRIDDLGISLSTNPRTQSDNCLLFIIPGELRNRIYLHLLECSEQALVVHRPRMATLRQSTRIDRSRPLSYGDDESQDVESTESRTSYRTSVALTQVSRQMRSEFYPMYQEHQEIGLDLTDLDKFMDTYFHPSMLTQEQFDAKDWPFRGNLTIALGDFPTKAEKKGIDLWPLLNVWANSVKIEAGFGRYSGASRFTARAEGEAKDMYRLFGRKVLPDRSCSKMNRKWRTTMRDRLLEAVIVYRAPARTILKPGFYKTAIPANGTVAAHDAYMWYNEERAVRTKPYIHMVYRYECAEPWMRSPPSVFFLEPAAEWLEERGFDDMEFFDIKVSCGFAKAKYPNQTMLDALPRVVAAQLHYSS